MYLFKNSIYFISWESSEEDEVEEGIPQHYPAH